MNYSDEEQKIYLQGQLACLQRLAAEACRITMEAIECPGEDPFSLLLRCCKKQALAIHKEIEELKNKEVKKDA
jgi:hypothetical protein